MPAPQGAAPFRGSPQCAHWGKGSPDSDTVQTGKDSTYPDHSFPHWHSLCPLSLACARQLPRRGSQGRRRSPPPRRALPRSVRAFPPPRRALPLLGEVPSAHTGERGLRGRTWSRREKTVRSADHSFPYWHSDCPLSLACARQLPRRGSQAALQIAASAYPHLRHSETSSQTGRGNPFSFTPQLVFGLSQGDADCRVARSSLLAMTA